MLAVSHGLLPALGVQPEIGRGFSAADDAPGAPDTVMLTLMATGSGRSAEIPASWKRVLTINARPHQIIGVMPAEFRFGGELANTTTRVSSPDIILPLRINRAGRRLYGGTWAWPG